MIDNDLKNEIILSLTGSGYCVNIVANSTVATTTD
jgi:hypothetical protein